jgi:hypothetical protein
MFEQTRLKLERDAIEIEGMANKARSYVFKLVPKKKPKTIKNIKNFMEFFAVPPIGTDPYGIMRKIDMLIRNSENRFKYFVKQIAPGISEKKQMNIKSALAGAMTAHQIAKIVRHYVELIKKYKMFQMGMVIQMQIPLIKSIAKASMHATHAFAEEIAIGDGIGALVAANLIKGKPRTFKNEEFVVYKTKINNRNVLIAKADGPGATTGQPGKFFLKLIKNNRISRIITIDAGMKLEGEKPGTVAEGVGIAMGGSGVDRYEMEEIAVKKNLPLDAVAIKVSAEEALMPMRKEILNSVPTAIEAVQNAVARAGKRENILIMGIGNTCGVGNDIREAKQSEEKMRKFIRKHAKKKKK